MKLNASTLGEARKASSPDELMEIAKRNGLALMPEAAEEYYKKLNSEEGTITEDELQSVSGGGCGGYGCDINCGTITYH